MVPFVYFKKIVIFVALFMIVAVSAAEQNPSTMTDDQIKHILMQQSITSYPGNCPCPYFTDRAGRSCGKRSAWSRVGGYQPLCYSNDVTSDMIKQYRGRIDR